MVGHAYDGLPDEACGLLAGPPGTSRVTRFYPCTNAAGSSRYYTIDNDELDRVFTDAEANGLLVIGTMHSHTHTEAYPSPTDVEAADPTWVYVIVSLRQDAPVLRAYRMRDRITEERVSLSDG
jgi:[CysO sulfur-carrier protein]-S-L-cysteine hydrolase